MKYKQWSIQSPSGDAKALERGGIPPLTAHVMAARGYRTAQGAKKALSCGVELLHDPELLADMSTAVARIHTAIQRRERICVYGDYDVDGITSTCLLCSHLSSMGAIVFPYIPNRLNEGYSLNRNTLLELKEKDVQLIITVDCGITNLEETLFARELGMDIVITDHHECKPELPQAFAVVNPHRPDCPYPFKKLAGVGVALKVALALTPPEQRYQAFLSYADLTAIGTVADVMELTGENRAIVAIGLKQLQHTRRAGLRMLLQEAGLLGKSLTSTSISYSLAPRLNAAGRMGCPNLAVQLLLTESTAEAQEYAHQLCDLNRERQLVELETFEQCATLLEQHPSMREHAIVLAGENWHQGVIGIVASRLVERYQLPTFMISLENGHGKGSCRSNMDGLNLFAALEQCADLLDTFGGHEQAAGFTLPTENIAAFRTRITAIAADCPPECVPHNQLVIDIPLSDASLLTLPQVEQLQHLEPYGAGNPRPVFLLENTTILNCSSVGTGRHTRFQLQAGKMTLDAIFFSASLQETGLQAGEQIDVAFYPQINSFRGTSSVQLLVTDIRRTLSPIQRDLLLYRRYVSGEALTQQELLRLLPERQHFVAVWRYLSRPDAPSTVAEAPVALTRHIASASGRPQPCATTMICLEVLQERGLIDLSVSAHQIHIVLRRDRSKVDLEQSTIMRRLRRMMD